MTISCWLTTMGSPSRVSEVSFQHVTFLTYPEPRGIGIPELNWRFSKLVSLVSLELELLMGTSKKNTSGVFPFSMFDHRRTQRIDGPPGTSELLCHQFLGTQCVSWFKCTPHE